MTDLRLTDFERNMNKFIERVRGWWCGMESERVREGESSMESQMVVGRVEQGQRGGQKEFETAREPLYYKYHL